MEIPCTFKYTTFSDEKRFYSCTIKNQQIPEENQEFNFIGRHNYGRTSEDVIYVEFQHCKINKVPQGLTKIFPNMKMLWISGGQLKKISKNDFVEYKNLERFSCSKNEIEFLPGDLFEDIKNLNWISFYANNIKVVEPNIFDGLEKLTFVNLENKPNLNFRYSAEYEDSSCFVEIKRKLMENYIEYSRNLKNSEEKLEIQVQQLKDLNEDLEQQNISIKESNVKLRSKLEKEKLKTDRNPQCSLFKDLKTLINDETKKDFHIQIDDHEFQAHKFLLAARSPTLAEILKNNPEVENLNLVDISVDIFEIILKFLYTDELPGDDGTNFMQLFTAAGRLKIEELKNFVAEKIYDLINAQNALEILNLSNKYEHEELRQRAFEEIKRKYPNIEFEDAWMSDGDKIEKIIEFFTKMKQMENEFKKTPEILKNNPEVENLNLVDISVEIFEIILKFLYTDELPGDDGMNFLQLFAAAGKLKVEELKDFAAEKLIDTMDAENALEIFKIACKYDHKELKQKGFKIIKDKYPGSKFKDEWIDDAEKAEKLITYLKKIQEAEKEIEGLM